MTTSWYRLFLSRRQIPISARGSKKTIFSTASTFWAFNNRASHLERRMFAQPQAR